MTATKFCSQSTPLGSLPGYHTLEHGRLRAEVSAHGARLLQLYFDDQPLLLAYPSAALWLEDIYAVNAVCGRVANRIGGATFSLGGRQYALSRNLGEHTLHGGARNFSNQSWATAERGACEAGFEIHSPDGDQGFPGRVHAQVHYALLEGNQMRITLSATTDATTPIDLTHHAYFTLGEPDCRNLRLSLRAQEVLEKHADLPTGKALPLNELNLSFDHNIGQHIERWRQKKRVDAHGFDHYFPLAKSEQCGLPKAQLQPAAVLLGNKLKMTLHTNQPGILLYTAGHLSGEFSPFSGVCLEAQGYPNAVNRPEFPSPLVSPGQRYQREILLTFAEREHAHGA
ncbi:galactose mutarotase [Simiduia sp. 21SJ11W-1]|uniref:aldose epimerase family protein n=1 Tax=Simiduia sp. 21SJ11W-1 TaxID=2909669 RepID=UPI00209D1048|nr:aldose epimerase family protein [Simiduia sp. 21SJ11W-1]UTA48325.1 galactose mutarotase [Simiduia sp. 21SJ11W-1]